MGNSKPTQSGHLLQILLILTGFFILAEISFLIQRSGLYLGDIKLVANHLSVPVGVVWPGIAFFIIVQLLLHLAFVFSIFFMALGLKESLRLSQRTTEITGISLWFLTIITILLSNQVNYPNSKFSVFSFSAHSIVIYGVYRFLFSVLIILIVLAGFGLLKKLVNHSRIVILVTVITGFLAICLCISEFQVKPVVTDAASQKTPNIIVIGIDSLRPDTLGFSGSHLKTPHLDSFLNGATVFSEAMTPLARTYPAWVSILTGLYPKVSGARTDLLDPAHLDLSHTLPAVLRQHGYQTLYASDETRFSNIDGHYGFDEVATAPMGFNDFLLGTLNDFPLSNLLVNTAAGRYLFPYTYGNRAVFALYDPDSFLKKMATVLATPRNKPLFLAIHFCLPHYPYAWASLPVKKVMVHHYQASIERADQQFEGFMQLLQKNRLLDNSIVILLSDHGEGVETTGDRITDPDLYIGEGKAIPRFYPPSSDHERVNTSGGHGTDVLGLPQYHIVLAFRSYGLDWPAGKEIPGIATLLDIRSTLLDYLNINSGKTDGISLMSQIRGQVSGISARNDFFVESDFSPEAVRSVHPEARKVLFEGIDYFQIDPHSARITVRDNMLKMILSSKQYADYEGNWVLALYPQNATDMMPVLVNLQTGEWTTSLATPFALHSPAEHMLAALRGFFKNDITTVKNS